MVHGITDQEQKIQIPKVMYVMKRKNMAMLLCKNRLNVRSLRCWLWQALHTIKALALNIF
jgi:hypothetical protein